MTKCIKWTLLSNQIILRFSFPMTVINFDSFFAIQFNEIYIASYDIPYATIYEYVFFKFFFLKFDYSIICMYCISTKYYFDIQFFGYFMVNILNLIWNLGKWKKCFFVCLYLRSVEFGVLLLSSLTLLCAWLWIITANKRMLAYCQYVVQTIFSLMIFFLCLICFFIIFFSFFRVESHIKWNLSVLSSWNFSI